MSTVKRMVHLLAVGQLQTDDVVLDFATRPWPRGKQDLTEGQRFGTEDVGPPSDNSPDWIEIEPGLLEEQRERLREAYDRAQGAD